MKFRQSVAACANDRRRAATGLLSCASPLTSYRFLFLLLVCKTVLAVFQFSRVAAVVAEAEESSQPSAPVEPLLYTALWVLWNACKFVIAICPLLFICYIFFSNRSNDPKYVMSRKPDFSFAVD